MFRLEMTGRINVTVVYKASTYRSRRRKLRVRHASGNAEIEQRKQLLRFRYRRGNYAARNIRCDLENSCYKRA